MKTALTFLAVTILILGLLSSRVDVWFGRSTIDIHVHDTYVVMARWHFILFIILILGTFSSLGGIIGTRFQNKIFLAVFLAFLVVDTFIIWSLYRSFHQG